MISLFCWCVITLAPVRCGALLWLLIQPSAVSKLRRPRHAGTADQPGRRCSKLSPPGAARGRVDHVLRSRARANSILARFFCGAGCIYTGFYRLFAILPQAAYSDAAVVKVVPVITKSTASSSAASALQTRQLQAAKMHTYLTALLVLGTAANAQKMTADIVSCPG